MYGWRKDSKENLPDSFQTAQVLHRINDLANDVDSEVLNRIKRNNFTILLDESTDVANATVLLVYVRCIF